MMSSGKHIHCWIVAVPDQAGAYARTADHARRIADPFIDGLIAKLQAEVRNDRQRHACPMDVPLSRSRFDANTGTARGRHVTLSERADAEITWHDWPLDFSEPDFDAWERGSVLRGDRWNLPR